jgi:hypothetical protein
MRTRLLLLAGCTLALSFLLAAPTFAQKVEPGPACSSNNVEYFPETGHNVCDQFLEFFNSRGGPGIFGYPLTEWVTEDGRLVQYFQRVRMEYHPENPPRYQVQLGLLGDSIAPPDEKARIPESRKPKSNDPEQRYFPETGHTVRFSFLKFYNENGGLDNFGYPVTEFILENGRIVQYFQRALMEWNPNRGGIVLHNLGEMWVDQHGHLRPLKEPVPPLIINPETPLATPPITSLHATASVRDAFTTPDGDQIVWVYVYNQNGEPVEGAKVELMVHYPSDPRRYMIEDPTDNLGHTQTKFKLGNPTPGHLVVVDAIVKYGGLTTKAQTSFFTWW